MSADEFLDLYKTLEQSLKTKYQNKSGQYENHVMRFAHSPQGERYKEDLDSIRELRNLLQHLPKTDGQYIAEPSVKITAKLRQIVNSVQNPRKAINSATKREQLLICRDTDNVFQLMDQMEKRGHTNVPLLRDERVCGVFSRNTVFSYIIRAGCISHDLKIRDFADFLPLDAHSNERYAFARADELYDDVREMFEKGQYTRNKRLTVVFLTDSGCQDGHLVGMITPWDVIKES